MSNFSKFCPLLISGTNLDLIGGKYFIKIVFDIEIEIAVLEISNMSNFNKL